MTRLFLLILIALMSPTGSGGAQAPDLGQLYEEALASMAEESWPDAVAKLEAILAEEPSHIPSRFNLAISLNEAGQTDRAISEYREILTLDPQMFEARMNLASLLHAEELLEEAIILLEGTSRQRPDDPEPVLYRAELLDQAGRWDEAEQSYGRVLEMDPDSMTAQYRLGFLYLRTDRPELAFGAFLEAERLGATTDPAVFLAMGDLASQENDLESAKRYYVEASRRAPELETIRLRLGLVLRDLGEPTEAISVLQDVPGALPIIGEIHFSNQEYAAAVPIYEDLVAQEPGNAEYWLVLGNCYYETGLADQAVPALQRGLEIDPGLAEGWGTLAAIYLEREDWANAQVALVEHVKLRPDFAPSHFALATSFDHLQNFEQALVHYNRFLELDNEPDSIRTFEVLDRVATLEDELRDN